jgi:hypothetical protein
MKNSCSVRFFRPAFRFAAQLLLLCLSVLPDTLLASENQRDVQKFTLLIGSKSIQISKVYDSLDVLLKKNKFKMVHPHKIVDPKSAELEYSGIEFRQILEQAGLNKSQIARLSKSYVSFIGRDGYTISVPVEDALAAKTHITGYREGQFLNWRSGAPFLAFADTTKKNYFSEQSWWAWWISIVIIGEPKMVLKVEDSVWDHKKLQSVCKQTTTASLTPPRGRRKKDVLQAAPGEISFCTLDTILPSAKDSAGVPQRLRAEFLTGQTLQIGDASKYKVVYKFNKNPIPSSYGGQFHLCEVDGKQECRYFLEKLSKAD